MLCLSTNRSAHIQAANIRPPPPSAPKPQQNVKVAARPRDQKINEPHGARGRHQTPAPRRVNVVRRWPRRGADVWRIFRDATDADAGIRGDVGESPAWVSAAGQPAVSVACRARILYQIPPPWDTAPTRIVEWVGGAGHWFLQWFEFYSATPVYCSFHTVCFCPCIIVVETINFSNCILSSKNIIVYRTFLYLKVDICSCD